MGEEVREDFTGEVTLKPGLRRGRNWTGRKGREGVPSQVKSMLRMCASSGSGGGGRVAWATAEAACGWKLGMIHRGACKCTGKGRDSVKWDSHVIILTGFGKITQSWAAGREASTGRLLRRPDTVSGGLA